MGFFRLLILFAVGALVLGCGEGGQDGSGDCGECPQGQQCVEGVCSCAPQCEENECGDDGCSGSCGECDDGLDCSDDYCDDGECKRAFQPSFCVMNNKCLQAGTVSFANPCEKCNAALSQLAWSAAENGTKCLGDGVCVEGVCCDRAANCEGMDCGDDGCGGECGSCPQAAPICEEGLCKLDCLADCDGKECGDDDCGESCGTCPAAAPFCIDFLCQADCVAECVGKDCGGDGCGGSCGTCPAAAPECVEGACQPVCVPDCIGLECGDDGCSGNCGACPQDEECSAWGQCISSETCVDKCVSMDCGEVDDCVCGVCSEEEYCSWGQCVPAAEECDEVCGEVDCGIVSIWGGIECDCGYFCPVGFECNETLNWCECVPICADPNTGEAYECGDDDNCGYSCGTCNLGECVEHKCACNADCTDKECGPDGCGATCGTCPGWEVCGMDGKCYQDCAGMEYTALEDVQKVVFEAVGDGGHPGEALDIDQDPNTCAPAGDCEDGLNNQMSGLLGNLSAFVDVDAELAKALDEGTRVTIAECIGLNLDGEPFTVNIYRGIPVKDKAVCDFQTDYCPYYIDASSLNAAGCKPVSTFDNATIVNGIFTAGGVGYSYVFDGFMMSPELPLLSPAGMAQMTGTVEELGGGQVEVHDGIIGYAINKAEFMEQLAYIDDSELPVSVEMMQNLFDMFLEPDVDANGDGELDSASMAVKFETIPGTIVGIANPEE